MSTSSTSPAVLVLEDGRTFTGTAYGATGETVGEAVFSTGMTGYQETLTDPSYHRQVVVMTAPHIGNTGANASMARIVRLGTNCPAMAAGEPAVFDFLGMKIFVSRPRIQGLCRNPSYLYLV